MSLWHHSPVESSAEVLCSLESTETFRELSMFLDLQMSRSPEEIARDLPQIERQLGEALNRLGSEITRRLLERLDLRADGVLVDEKPYRRRHKDGSATILSTFGPVRISYALYEERGGHGGQTVAPLKMRAGLVEDFWTPQAAQVAALYVQATTPAESHRLLAASGGMTPSVSSLERLPKVIAEVVEANREEVASQIRATEVLPEVDRVAVVAVTIDGVMTLLKDAKQLEVAQGKAESSHGYKEAGCATISLCDAHGERLRTIRLARMPEYRKVTLQKQLQAELAAIHAHYPAAEVVALADGAEENWRILREIRDALGITGMVEILDFFHAEEHVAKALTAHARTPFLAECDVKLWRHKLLEEPGGVDRLIRALKYRIDRSQGKDVKIIKQTVGYLERHRDLMAYSVYRTRKLPIGSGIQEAACKTLVTQRLKRSGMSWRQPGGQAILTLRSWAQSDRFDLAFKHILPRFCRPVTVDPKARVPRWTPKNITPLRA